MRLRDLVLADVFCQMNPLNGWRALDHLGAILGRLAQDFPVRQIENDTVRVTDPDGHLQQVTISPDRMWCHWMRPDSIAYVKDHTVPLFEDLAQIAGFEDFSRLGARFVWVKPEEDSDALPTVLARRLINEKLFPWNHWGTHVLDAEVAMRLAGLHEVKAIVRVMTIRRGEAPGVRKELLAPQRGVALDIDVYEDEVATIGEWKAFLARAERVCAQNVEGFMTQLWEG